MLLICHPSWVISRNLPVPILPSILQHLQKLTLQKIVILAVQQSQEKMLPMQHILPLDHSNQMRVKNNKNLPLQQLYHQRTILKKLITPLQQPLQNHIMSLHLTCWTNLTLHSTMCVVMDPEALHLLDYLVVDPTSLKNADTCIKRYKQLNETWPLDKMDLLFFPIVSKKHWVLVCVSIFKKQIAFFDSLGGGSKESSLFNCAENLIANFASTSMKAGVTP